MTHRTFDQLEARPDREIQRDLLVTERFPRRWVSGVAQMFRLGQGRWGRMLPHYGSGLTR